MNMQDDLELDFQNLSTREICDELAQYLAVFPACGPVTLAAVATRAAEVTHSRAKDLDWARTTYLVAECYRRLVPFARIFRIHGLDMRQIYRNHAIDSYEAAREVFLSYGDELDVARCDAGLRVSGW
jgi:hypothetical protein